MAGPPSLLPTLTSAARDALKRAMDRPGVVQAAIVGSYARGEQHAGSDLDIAVWLAPELEAQEALELCSDLLRDAQSAVGDGPPVDLVDLRRAGPVVRHRTLRDADVLIERDHPVRVRFDRDTLIEYWDTAPLRERQAQELRRRLQDGRFGRR